MNVFAISGNLGRDPEIRYSQGSNMAIATGTIAVKRTMKDNDGNYPTDWFNYTAFGKTAEYLEKYAHKGDFAIIKGRMEIDRYKDKDGNEKTAYKVMADSVEVRGEKKETGSDRGDGFVRVPDLADDELPFA